MENMQILVVARKHFRDIVRMVTASILDHDHFERKGLLIKKIKHLLQRAGQPVFLVMSRDDDGKEWIQFWV